MNPQSLNRYSYCLNNPLRYIDPSGQSELNPQTPEEYEALIRFYLGGCRSFNGGNNGSNPDWWFYGEEDDDYPGPRWEPGIPWPELPNIERNWTQTLLWAGEGFLMIVTVAALPIGIGAEVGITGAQILTSSELSTTITSYGRVFYSGGDLAKLAAEQFAVQNGGTILNITKIGRGLDVVIDKIGYDAARRIVVEASASYARGASGEVHVFLNLQRLLPDSVYLTVEREILMKNPNVTKIIYHTIGDLFLGP